MEQTRIAIVDDHKLFRDGLAELIGKFEEFSVIIEADNGSDLIKKLKKDNPPHIVILDINMKEMDGYETAAWLRDKYPDIKILILSMYENENAIIRMLKLGVKGYVLKDIRKQELLQALTSLVQKGYYYTDLVTGKLIHTLTNFNENDTGAGIKEITSLNRREIEFLKLVCTELTYKDIADKMNLSIHTIDGYRDALFEKLHVKSRVGLVMYAIKNKLVMVD